MLKEDCKMQKKNHMIKILNILDLFGKILDQDYNTLNWINAFMHLLFMQKHK